MPTQPYTWAGMCAVRMKQQYWALVCTSTMKYGSYRGKCWPSQNILNPLATRQAFALAYVRHRHILMSCIMTPEWGSTQSLPASIEHYSLCCYPHYYRDDGDIPTRQEWDLSKPDPSTYVYVVFPAHYRIDPGGLVQVLPYPRACIKKLPISTTCREEKESTTNPCNAGTTTQKGCSRKDCRYKHICWYCRSRHPGYKCPACVDSDTTP